MERRIEFFTVREVLESGLKGFCQTFSQKYKYQTVFYNNTDKMENAQMFVGVWFKDNFYELNIVMKRDRIEFDDKFIVKGDKGVLYDDFQDFIFNVYPIVKTRKTNNKLYISEASHDYEVSFILKRGVTK